MLRAAALTALVMIGCGRRNFDERFDAAVPEGEQAGGALCAGTLVRVCFPTPPTTPLMLSGTIDIDTHTSPMCDPSNDRATEYCVVAGSAVTLELNGTIRAHGAKPLVLLSTGAMDLFGAIDVSGHHDPGGAGAGANPTTCAVGDMPPTDAGGGYGGSFGGRGGRGKDTQGTAATAPPPLPNLPNLRGGCSGSPGSTPASVTGGGAGGTGGGAIAIVASASIHLQGRINASGGGGHGGAQVATGAGGGGGGSGGMILIDTPSFALTTTAQLFANGGGGGEGGGPSAAGIDGEESTGPGSVASGGIVAANDESGDGASGSVGTMLDGASAIDPVCASGSGSGCIGGGGGGGGAAGFIHAPGIIDPAVISPPSL